MGISWDISEGVRAGIGSGNKRVFTFLPCKIDLLLVRPLARPDPGEGRRARGLRRRVELWKQRECNFLETLLVPWRQRFNPTIRTLRELEKLGLQQ